jgi:mono/diheme cytochrome c family protein
MKRILIWALIGIFWGTALLSGESAAADGRSLYMDKCAICHGINGDGNGPGAGSFTPRPTDFRTPRFWEGNYERNIDSSVKKGFREMPAIPLSDAEIKAVTEYMVKSFKR